jgi:hypothetical protein
MPTISAVAFNTGSTIPGTTQIGNLSIGDLVLDFNALGQQYGVTYYATPDQDLGYVIGYPDIYAGHLGKPNNVPAKIGFFRSSGLTESSFIVTAQYVTQMIGNSQTFLSGNAAKTWLNNNGYWTSWVNPTPTLTVYARTPESVALTTRFRYAKNCANPPSCSWTPITRIPFPMSSSYVQVNDGSWDPNPVSIGDVIRFVVRGPGNNGIQFGGGFNGSFTGNCNDSNPYTYTVVAGQNDVYLNINVVSGAYVSC